MPAYGRDVAAQEGSVALILELKRSAPESIAGRCKHDVSFWPYSASESKRNEARVRLLQSFIVLVGAEADIKKLAIQVYMMSLRLLHIIYVYKYYIYSFAYTYVYSSSDALRFHQRSLTRPLLKSLAMT